jgi:Zn-dependent peptidase ImmA (M78 family)/DNA-binding XRE family transcriptional regulator
MKNFPDRLKNARKMHSLSLQDLAEKTKNLLSKQDISRLENDISKPNSEILASLTNALGLSNDYFFRENGVVLENVAFRKLVKLPKKHQESVISKTQEYLERYHELEDLLGIVNTSPIQFQIRKIIHESEIEIAAVELRDLLELGLDPIYNIVELLEEKGVKVIASEPIKSFSGMSANINNKLMVIVFNNDENLPLVRRRFTILHELAHLFLDLSHFEDEKKVEKLCDRFAGAMLLPASKLEEYMGGKREKVLIKELNAIKEYFGISLPTIMYKAKDLNLISDHYHKYFMINYNQFYKKNENSGYEGKENSTRFIQLLLRAVAQEVISTTKAASLNNQKLGDFRKEYLDNY